MPIDGYIIKGNWHLTSWQKFDIFQLYSRQLNLQECDLHHRMHFSGAWLHMAHIQAQYVQENMERVDHWFHQALSSNSKGFFLSPSQHLSPHQEAKRNVVKDECYSFPHSFVIWSDAFHLVVFPAAWPTDPYCTWQRRIENSSDALLITSLRAFKLSKPLSFYDIYRKCFCGLKQASLWNQRT